MHAGLSVVVQKMVDTTSCSCVSRCRRSRSSGRTNDGRRGCGRGRVRRVAETVFRYEISVVVVVVL